MAVINVYEQYFSAECTVNGTERHAAKVMLISDSENGSIKYEAAVSFFPHNSDDDYAVSYDAYFSKVIYESDGRRSKKREKQFIESIREYADELSEIAEGRIFWDQPLREARYG